MSLEEPERLNEEFVRMFLQNGDENRSIVITKLYVNLVVPPGNNYGSCLRRVKVEYKQGNSEDIHNLSVVVKWISPILKDSFAQFSEIEHTFYECFLPETLKISQKVDFAPKTYMSSDPDVSILEDLKDSGFLMADRLKMLDFDHCRLYVNAAATFHAVSVAVHKKRPELVESIGVEKVFSNDLKSSIPVKRYYTVGVHFLADEMEYIDGYKKYSDVIRDSSNIVWDLTVEAHKRNAILNTLHQGDPWTTNMMFRYDSSGKVTEVKLLDFQGLRYSSPVNDLVFFLWTSATHEVRETKLEDLYHMYCNSLNEKLEEFGCSERLSYEQLLENLRLLSPMALILAANGIPLMINETPVDVDEVWTEKSEEVTVRNMLCRYYDDEYRKTHLPRILKQLESVGIFDYMKSCLPNKIKS
uniref:CHK kinase-like domain-containing protein n=1 Tax=Graphocephala atropunctata TaxID=36148 RepID=A0A1B6KP25_9HEMI